VRARLESRPALLRHGPAAVLYVIADAVVDGDVVALRPGDQVVADGAVVESSSLMLDESQLSGESRAVAKGVGDELLSGSFCVRG